MGFLTGHAEIFVTKFVIYTLMLLGIIHYLLSDIYWFISLKWLLRFKPPSYQTQPDPLVQIQSLSNVLLRELLPVVKFSELTDPTDSCVVCLSEFHAGDDIPRLRNCKHVFHLCCIDRWMDHDRNTCPLCLTPFIP